MRTSDGTASLNKSIAARAAAFYAAFGTAWVVISDSAAYLFDKTDFGAMILNIAKSEIFVGASSIALYLCMSRWNQERWLERRMLDRRLTQISECANDIILLIDSRSHILDANDRAVQAYGRSRDELLRLTVSDLRGDGPVLDWRSQWISVIDDGNLRFEATHLRADGSPFPVEVSSRKIARGNSWVVQSIVRDISERKEAERQILRLRDVYAALSQTNQCIVRVTDRSELFATICDIAIRFGHFRMAWIGLVDPLTQTVTPAHTAGHNTAAFDSIVVSTANTSPHSMGSSGQAVISGRPAVCNDITADDEIRARHPWADRNGCRSVAAFPLGCGGETIGVLTLYSGEPNFFRNDLLHLLEEMASDISYALDRMMLEAAHRHATFEMRKLLTAVEQSPVTIVVTDIEGTIEYVNPAFTESSGYSREDAIGKNPRILRGDNDPGYAELWARIKGGHSWQGMFHNRHKSGSLYWEEAVIAPVRDETGGIRQFIGIKQDVTRRIEAEARLEFIAHHDPITHLPNRLLGKDRMEQAVRVAAHEGGKTAVLLIDIDHFRRINDSLGHNAGDSLLAAMATRLRGCLEETDTLCRQGNDEFLAVLPHVRDIEAVSRSASRMVTQIVAPFNVAGHALPVTISTGIALYPDDGTDLPSLFRHADAALLRAKENGGNTYCFFDEKADLDAREYVRILGDLRRAIENHEFILEYQPQISLETGRVVGAEALIRWQHPERGLIPPGQFIPTAEESGLIVEIGDWVLQEACNHASAWHGTAAADVVVAVNISALQFRRGKLASSVRRALAASGIPAKRLELEMTESGIIRDTDYVLRTMEQIKTIGTRLSIDDFGTGYSSLSYLQRFNISKLKIDRSFITDIRYNANNETIVRAIIQLAHGLGIKTIAEGVEDEETIDIIRAHGCDEVQGFLYAKPMPAEHFVDYVATCCR
jgi:diguanylate cyclase (GGDEF)-like protein/PAS domain S-box-containing protein